MQKSTHLVSSQGKPLMSPCLLNLPPANLEWPSSSLSLSLSSTYGGQLHIIPGNHPSLQTSKTFQGLKRSNLMHCSLANTVGFFPKISSNLT